ncbi:MAG: DNRLRE domain-containing protein [Pirellulales bacterium]|nr:DNRLRE domain-containing protein [Pirellulales bacterium]
MIKLFSRWLVVVLLAAGLCLAAQAQAAVHMADSFLSGVDPLSGQYAPGDLIGQGPTVSSFTGNWAAGLTTTSPGNFDATATGLAWTDLINVAGGAVQFTGDGQLTTAQAAVRTFSNPNMVADGDYWLACMMSFDEYFVNDDGLGLPNTNSSAYVSILNAEEGDPEPGTNMYLGVQVGFRGNDTGGVDAVMRLRQKTSPNTIRDYVVASDVSPGTHLFVVHVNSDITPTNSGDYNSVWFDPAVGAVEHTAGLPAYGVEAANWVDPNYIDRPERIVDTVVFNATELGTGSVVTYDEVRFGDSWTEVVNANTSMPATGTNIAIIKPLNTYDHAGTFVRESQPTTTQGTSLVLQVGSLASETTAAMRSMLSFSLDQIPTGTVVTGATLRLSVSRVDETDGEVGSIDLYLADLPDGFDETKATWNLAYDDTENDENDIAWTNGPGNPTATLLSSFDPDATTTEVIFASSAEFIAAVQYAINHDTPLDLALLATTFESSGLRQFIEFDSEDTYGDYLHPMLSLTFGDPLTITVPGDTNADDAVDEEDAATLASHWGAAVTNGAWDGDFNDDGFVTAADAAILAANWTGPIENAEQVGVPEPSTLVLMSVACVLFTLRRRIV